MRNQLVLLLRRLVLFADADTKWCRKRLQGREIPQQAVLTSQGEETLKSLEPPVTGGEILQGEDAVMLGAGEMPETAQEDPSEYDTAEEFRTQEDTSHYDTAREDFAQDTARKAIARKRATRKNATHKKPARKDTTRKAVTLKSATRKAVSVQAAPRKPTTRNDTARKNIAQEKTAQDYTVRNNIAQDTHVHEAIAQEVTVPGNTAQDVTAYGDMAHKDPDKKPQKGKLHTVETPRGPYTIFIPQQLKGIRQFVFVSTDHNTFAGPLFLTDALEGREA